MDPKTPIRDVVNRSINQSFGRSFNTSLCTFTAVAVVAVMALALHMDSITSFAVPMMFGIVSGFYTSMFLCSPLWAAWVEYKEKKESLAKANGRQKGRRQEKGEKSLTDRQTGCGCVPRPVFCVGAACRENPERRSVPRSHTKSGV